MNGSITSHRPIVLKLAPARNLADVRSSTSSISRKKSNDTVNTNVSVIHSQLFKDGNIAASVLLGRNKYTGIKTPGVSRALCEVSFSRRQENLKNVKHNNDSNDNHNNNDRCTLIAHVIMRKPPTKPNCINASHTVCINGYLVDEPIGRPIPIQDGSIISLSGEKKFAYLVRILEVDDTVNSSTNGVTAAAASTTSTSISSESETQKFTQPPEKSSSAITQRMAQPIKSEDPSLYFEHKSPIITEKPTALSPTKHRLLRKRSHQLMIGEQTCALCMDILIKSTFAYPCGHAFCHSCTTSCNNKCPSCRGDVKGWMPARSYDTIIWATALQGCFEKEDAKAYLERRREHGEDEPTEMERECILGNDGDDNDDCCEKKGYYVPSPIKNGVPTVASMPPIYSNESCMAAFCTNAANNMARRGTSADDPICLD